jgi:hypothetical protein
MTSKLSLVPAARFLRAGLFDPFPPMSSPDEAKRNPGTINKASMPLPDFTPFHPGYERNKGSGTPAGAYFNLRTLACGSR